jgi:hypothetical protein
MASPIFRGSAHDRLSEAIIFPPREEKFVLERQRNLTELLAFAGHPTGEKE